MNEIIGGTVIQRSFIGREASNIIHIATVPIAELGIDSDDPLSIVAEVLGIPVSNVLDQDGYLQVLEHVSSLPPDYFLPYWGHPRFHESAEHFYRSLQSEGSPKELFSDFLAAMGESGNVGTALVPWAYMPFVDARDYFELNSQALGMAMQCIASRATRSSQSDEFIGEVFCYDIPMGQSPAVKSDSLLELLETSRKFCVAPLALGGAQAISQLTQGSYVAALLTTGTAGVMTLVLIGTVSVGALIVQRVAQARAKAAHVVKGFTPTPAAQRAVRRPSASSGNLEAGA